MVDEQEDDWAPLSEEQLAMRPGEVEDAPFVGEFARVAEPAPEPAAEPAVEEPFATPPKKPVDPRAEQMMRELEERVAKAGRGDSLISHVQRREHRTARKQKAKARVAPQLAATCVVGEAPPEPQPEFEIANKSDVDPRELETWFQKLPEAEQSRLRQSWHEERHQFDNSGKVARLRLRRAICYGALLYFGMGMSMVLLVGGFYMIPALTVAGAVAGGTACLLGGGRFVYSGCGLAAYLCVVAPSISANPFLLYGALMAAFVMGGVGMDSEMRRSAGYSKD